ncbi:hypothetical protein FKP32DRAFT_1680292, partial [Trametes sanguinea]
STPAPASASTPAPASASTPAPASASTPAPASAPDAEPSLLELVAREVSLEDLMQPPRAVPGASIYPGPKNAFVFQPLEVRFPVVDRASASSALAQPARPAGNPGPIVFPSVQGREEAAQEPAPISGTRITRQYAAFFDEDGHPLPTGREGSGEPDPIGEIVANILKAAHPGGPYPSTWRGSLFEPEVEPESAAASTPAAVSAPAPAPASSAAPAIP